MINEGFRLQGGWVDEAQAPFDAKFKYPDAASERTQQLTNEISELIGGIHHLSEAFTQLVTTAAARAALYPLQGIDSKVKPKPDWAKFTRASWRR